MRDSITQHMESEDDDMNFTEFCLRIANPEQMEIDVDTLDARLPYDIDEALHSLIDIVRLKIARANFIKISFIQNRFNDMNEVKEIMETRYNGEVNDLIAYKLATGLYHRPITELTHEELAIIKVLTIYLMIQTATHEENY